MHSVIKIFLALSAISFSKSARTTFCNECDEFVKTSSGPAAGAYPDSFGKYKRDGSLFESLLPFFLNPDTGLYVTPHPRTNVMFYYAPWVVSDSPIGSYNNLSAITVKTQDDYEAGITCPWDNDAHVWEYRTGVTEEDFSVDDTITVKCATKYNLS